VDDPAFVTQCRVLSVNAHTRTNDMKIRQLAPAVLCCFLLPGPTIADDRFEAETAREAEAVKLARDTQAGGYQLLNAAELRKLLDEGRSILLVDTMPYEASYRKEHLPGAKQFLFPIARMTSWNTKETDGRTEADFIALLGADKEKPMVVYCGFVKCTRSDNGAAWARKLGYTQVYRFPGGLFAWKGAGFPLEAVR